jgi:NADP-dependent 3-hydroxy acid dehydrogenase YdfG
MKRIIFITGATSGIGKASAEKFAANGDHLILNGRRKERLEELKTDLEEKYKVDILCMPFDVQQNEEVFRNIHQLPEKWKSIDILINNAGLALGRDLFDKAEITDWETMIDTNVKGLIYVSKALLPVMIEKKKGHIINLGSISGDEVYEGGNIYCATKSAVDAISRAMRIDLLKHHIKVTNIKPGATETEFSLVRFKGD